MTYRWAALGTLLAYSALGVTKVAIAAPWAKAKGKDGTPLGYEVRWEPFSGNTSGRKIRAWMSFAHTGAAGGLLGQSVASVASLGGVFLACTGTPLVIRRLLGFWSKAKPFRR